MAKYKDSNPVAGASKGGGKKNNDGRENGSAYDKQQKAKFDPKLTSMPNEGAPKLPQKGGLEEGAY